MKTLEWLLHLREMKRKVYRKLLGLLVNYNTMKALVLGEFLKE